MLRRRLTLTLLATVLLSACDRTPSDPLDARSGLAELMNGSTAGEPGAWTLPGLLHAALHRVYTEHGAATARVLVGDLRRVQDQSRQTLIRGDREVVDAALAAVQQAELALVLRVFGDAVVDRALAAVDLDLGRLDRAVADAEAAARDMSRPRELLLRAAALLDDARRHAAAAQPAPALDAATRAAAAADAVRNAVADTRRVPTLADLFDVATAHVRTAQGAAGEAAMLARHAELRQAAGAAVRERDRDVAQRALEAQRREEIRVVLHVLGVESAERLVEAVSRGIADVDGALPRGRDVTRVQRMLATARDMNVRARAALAAGDAATAVDLAGHAAGLVNTARLTLAVQ